MKHLLSILLLVFLAGCRWPVVQTPGNIGSAVRKCCEIAPFAKEGAPSRFINTESGGGRTEAAFFEPQIQLAHTW